MHPKRRFTLIVSCVVCTTALYMLYKVGNSDNWSTIIAHNSEEEQSPTSSSTPSPSPILPKGEYGGPSTSDTLYYSPVCNEVNPKWPPPAVQGPMGPFFQDAENLQLSVCNATMWFGDNFVKFYRDSPDLAHPGITVCGAKQMRWQLENSVHYSVGTHQGAPVQFEVQCDSHTPACGDGPECNFRFCAGPQGNEAEHSGGNVKCVPELNVENTITIRTADMPTYYYTGYAENNYFHSFVEGVAVFATLWEDGFVFIDKDDPTSAPIVEKVRFLRNPDARHERHHFPVIWQRWLSPLYAEQIPLKISEKYHFPDTIRVGTTTVILPYYQWDQYTLDLNRHVIPHYRDLILKSLDQPYRCRTNAGRKCLVLLSYRIGGQGRNFPNEAFVHQWVAEAGPRFPNCEIIARNLATITMNEQIELFQNTSVYIGATGAGHTNVLWMCPGRSAFIDIYPPVLDGYPLPDTVVNVYNMLADAVDINFYRIFSAAGNGGGSIEFEPGKIETVLTEALKDLNL